MSHARTLWEEGTEPGHQVVALGVAVALTLVALDVQIDSDVGMFFDVTFVAVCVAVALLVRPADFFWVGVLPPLMMLSVVALLAIARPGALLDGDASTLQRILTGLSGHGLALAIGYAACLLVLAVRDRFVRER